MCIYVSMCGYMHASANTHGVQKRASDPLKLKLQEVTATMQVLETELQPSSRTVCVLSLSSPPKQTF